MLIIEYLFNRNYINRNFFTSWPKEVKEEGNSNTNREVDRDKNETIEAKYSRMQKKKSNQKRYHF